MTKLKYIYKIDLFDCFRPVLGPRPVKKGPQPVIYNKARTGRTLADNQSFNPEISSWKGYEMYK